MDRYLIISPHTKGDCAKIVQEIYSMGYITHFDWGCNDGDHTGWAIIEADSPAEAMMVVPSFHRHTAKVVKLNKFSLEEVRAMHKK